jgi:hypothetical protein
LEHHTITTPNPKVRYAIAPNMITDWIIPQNLTNRMLDKIIAGKVGLKKSKNSLQQILIAYSRLGGDIPTTWRN